MIGGAWRLLQGYVIIKIKGAGLERFLNRAAGAGVPLYDAERISQRMLVARIHVSDFRKVRGLCRAQGWKVSIVRKVGLPFWLAALFRRKLLMAGGVFALGVIYVASSYIWFVQVDGDEGLPFGRIVEVAAGTGLRPGVHRSRVDRHEVQKALLLEIDELGWASVTLQGTLAVIHAAERVASDANLLRPGDVVAARDGIIENVTVFRGHPLVAEGATVKRGDVLISGFIPPGDEEHRRRLAAGEPPYVRADGIVKARVWYEGFASVRLVRELLEPTGERGWAFEAAFDERRIHLGRRPSGRTRESRSAWRLDVAGRTVELAFVRHEGVRAVLAEVDRAEAEREALAAAEAQLEAVLPRDAEETGPPERAVEIVEGDGGPVVEASVRVEVIEDIRAFREMEP